MKYIGVVVWQDKIDKGLGSHIWVFTAQTELAAWEIVERAAEQQVADRPLANNFSTNLRALDENT